MAKNDKKSAKKPPARGIKSGDKPTPTKSAKGSKPLVKSLMKAVHKVLGKTPEKPVAKAAVKPMAKGVAAKAQEKKSSEKVKPGKALSSNASMPESVKAPASKKDSKKAKKAKKSKDDEIDMGDDLVGDDDMGAEDIPDLAEFEEIEAEEVEDLDSDDDDDEIPARPTGDEEIVLTDAEGRRYCRVRDCDQISAVEGYCRFHYLQLWKKIQIRRKILVDGKLQRYVEELTARYPDKFLEMIRKDLRAEKDFHAAIAELEIDESAIDNEFEDEAQNFIDEVRGMTETSGMSDDQEEF